MCVQWKSYTTGKKKCYLLTKSYGKTEYIQYVCTITTAIMMDHRFCGMTAKSVNGMEICGLKHYWLYKLMDDHNIQCTGCSLGMAI
jgi:hypothetical protein